jgi:hypothetical protein
VDFCCIASGADQCAAHHLYGLPPIIPVFCRFTLIFAALWRRGSNVRLIFYLLTAAQNNYGTAGSLDFAALPGADQTCGSSIFWFLNAAHTIWAADLLDFCCIVTGADQTCGSSLFAFWTAAQNNGAADSLILPHCVGRGSNVRLILFCVLTAIILQGPPIHLISAALCRRGSWCGFIPTGVLTAAQKNLGFLIHLISLHCIGRISRAAQPSFNSISCPE